MTVSLKPVSQGSRGFGADPGAILTSFVFSSALIFCRSMTSKAVSWICIGWASSVVLYISQISVAPVAGFSVISSIHGRFVEAHAAALGFPAIVPSRVFEGLSWKVAD